MEQEKKATTDYENPSLLPVSLVPEGYEWVIGTCLGVFRCDIFKESISHICGATGKTPREAMKKAVDML